MTQIWVSYIYEWITDDPTPSNTENYYMRDPPFPNAYRQSPTDINEYVID